MDKIVYKENINMFKGWLNILMIGIAIFVEALAVSLYKKMDDQDGTVLLVSLSILAAFLLLMTVAGKYRTVITEGEICIRFLVSHRYSKEDIESCRIVDRKDILKKFWGFGIRSNRKSWGYIVNSTDAVEITIRNRKSVVVSTNNPDAFKAAIDSLIGH